MNGIVIRHQRRRIRLSWGETRILHSMNVGIVSAQVINIHNHAHTHDRERSLAAAFREAVAVHQKTKDFTVETSRLILFRKPIVWFEFPSPATSKWKPKIPSPRENEKQSQFQGPCERGGGAQARG